MVTALYAAVVLGDSDMKLWGWSGADVRELDVVTTLNVVTAVTYRA